MMFYISSSPFSRLLFFYLVLSTAALWAEVKLDMDMATQFYEGSPIYAMIIISHGKNEKIDPKSFKLDKEPLEAELQHEEIMTARGDLVLSIFNISLPPQPKGLHV